MTILQLSPDEHARVRPIGDFLLVRLTEWSRVAASGLVLPPQDARRSANTNRTGIVTAAGPGVGDPRLRPGVRVWFVLASPADAAEVAEIRQDGSRLPAREYHVYASAGGATPADVAGNYILTRARNVLAVELLD